MIIKKLKNQLPDIISILFITTMSTLSKLENLYLYEIHTEEENSEVRPPIKHVIVIDNSGSMGYNTHRAFETIASGLIGMGNQLPADIIYFDNDIKLHRNVTINNLAQHAPRYHQGRTNITHAINVSICEIMTHHKTSNERCHYVLTFLSDGEHNEGAILNDRDIMQLRKILDTDNVMLSVIIVGIATSDVRLGMKIKNGLETVAINSLSNVYYARDFSMMKSVLDELVVGCRQYLGSQLANLRIESGNFVENNQNTITCLLEKTNTICVRKIGEYDPVLYVNDKVVNCVERPFTLEMLDHCIDVVLPSLARQKMAHGNDRISDSVEFLESCIKIAERLAAQVDNVENFTIGTKSTSSTRVKYLKKIRGSENQFRESRNKLMALMAKVGNDSRSQAAYLDGIDRKYAAKAVARSSTVTITIGDVLKELQNLVPELGELLHQEVDYSISAHDSSFLSLNTPREQLQEWTTFDSDIFTDIYSLLVYFGFSCYPVAFQQNNAVQMDPFQTVCTYIEPYMTDTATIMLANQTGLKVNTPSRKEFVDGLILVNPAVKNTMKRLTNTTIYKYLCSVTLCRDLYMYHHRMPFAMHSHALVKTLSEFHNNKSTAYLELAMRIVYSSNVMGFRNDRLMRHWFNDWNTITQSQEDGCDHPVELLLLFASQKMDCVNNYYVPMINLFNEILARHFRIVFANYDSPRRHVIKMLQKIFEINETNCPVPDLENPTFEQNIVAIQESCKKWVDGVNSEELRKYFRVESFGEYINNVLLPYVITFEFGLALQQYPDDWQQDFCDNKSELFEYLHNKLSKINSVIEYLNMDSIIIDTMFMQAVLNHKSKSRIGIVDRDIFDITTYNDIIIELRMAIYYGYLAEHNERWKKLLSDKSYTDALDCDCNVFNNLIGSHTHGLNKEQFWAFLQAAINDRTNNPEKLEMFIKKSNSSVAGFARNMK